MKATTPLRAIDARALATTITKTGIDAPAPLTRAVEILDRLDHLEAPTTGILNLEDDDIAGFVDRIAIQRATAINQGAYAHREALDITRDGVAEEAAQALRDGGVDDLIKALRPRFDKAAKVLHKASQQYGFNTRTSAEDVLNLDNHEATGTYRAISEAISVITEIADVRIKLSRLLGVSPTLQESMDARGASTWLDPNVQFDFTICFAADGNWSVDGTMHVDKRADAGPDWLRMAATGLRLNTPTEVRELYRQRKNPGVRPLVMPDRNHPAEDRNQYSYFG